MDVIGGKPGIVAAEVPAKPPWRRLRVRGATFLARHPPPPGRQQHVKPFVFHLIAEPVLQLPNAQCGIHEAFGAGKAIR
jgi:hypothetical protein